MEVKVYTSPTCGYCHQAKRFLSERGVPFTEVDVSLDRAAAQEVVRLTGQMGVPVIVIDGQVVVGFDRPRLEQLLARRTGAQGPRFGLRVADASRIAPGALPVYGALVGAVAPGLPGNRAGIREGDIITEINMRPVRNADDLEQMLASLSRGSRVTVVFLRGDQRLTTETVV